LRGHIHFGFDLKDWRYVLNLMREFRHANHYRFRGYFQCSRVAVTPASRQSARPTPGPFMA
jgi:hypothetical protein